MKHLNYLILFLLIFSIISCKKETTTSNTNNTDTSVNNFKKMKYYVSEKDTMFLYYNSNQKVEKLINTQKKDRYYFFTYNNDGFYVDEYVNSVKTKTVYTCLFIENQKSKVVYSNDTLNFYYDGNNLTLISKKSYTNKYFWTNGNISKSIGGDTLYYEYLDNKNFGFWKVSNLGHETYLYDYENYIGVPVGSENINLVNLVKNSKGQIKYDFDYEFDKDGYVIKRIQKVYIYDKSGKQIDQYDRVNYFGWY